jgi:hypothetical protein
MWSLYKWRQEVLCVPLLLVKWISIIPNILACFVKGMILSCVQKRCRLMFIQYQFWCTRCPFRQLMSLRWCSDRTNWKSKLLWDWLLIVIYAISLSSTCLVLSDLVQFHGIRFGFIFCLYSRKPCRTYQSENKQTWTYENIRGGIRCLEGVIILCFEMIW